MKMLILFMVISTCAYSQPLELVIVQPHYKFKLEEHTVPLVFKFLEGAADGLRDASMFNRIRNAGDFWYGRDSWSLKYENRDPNQGPAFFGSTTIFVMFTDGPHLANSGAHLFSILSNTWLPEMVGMSRGKKFLVQVGYALVRSAGHNLVYGVIFKPK